MLLVKGTKLVLAARELLTLGCSAAVASTPALKLPLTLVRALRDCEATLAAESSASKP